VLRQLLAQGAFAGGFRPNNYNFSHTVLNVF
jgi:hypothetical protein